jgi:hypothetical protein
MECFFAGPLQNVNFCGNQKSKMTGRKNLTYNQSYGENIKKIKPLHRLKANVARMCLICTPFFLLKYSF